MYLVVQLSKAELLQLQLTPIMLPDANFINAKKLEIEKKAKPSLIFLVKLLGY